MSNSISFSAASGGHGLQHDSDVNTLDFDLVNGIQITPKAKMTKLPPRYYVVKKSPSEYPDQSRISKYINFFRRDSYWLGDLKILGRGDRNTLPVRWENNVTFYNIDDYRLSDLLNRVIIHHANNSLGVTLNELNQMTRKDYALLGYHFYIADDGQIFEGRPIEVVGSNAGKGRRGVDADLIADDPDWGAIGVCLNGNYENSEPNEEILTKQLYALEVLIKELVKKYRISALGMHNEVKGRDGDSTQCPGKYLTPLIKKLRNKLKLKAI